MTCNTCPTIIVIIYYIHETLCVRKRRRYDNDTLCVNQLSRQLDPGVEQQR